MTSNNDEHEIDLQQIFNIIWNSKLKIFSITSLFAIFSIYYALSLPNFYTSEATLQINNNEKDSGLSSLASNLGGISSLAGISLPSSENDKTMYVIETAQSREFLRHLIAFEMILPNIVASKSFDSTDRKIIYDKEVYDVDAKKWVRKPTKNKQTIPSYLEAHKFFYMKQFKILKDKESGFLKISYTHVSPEFAKIFLGLVIQELNKVTKDKDLKKSMRLLEYLKNELNSNQIKEINNSLNNLIESQIKTVALANIKDDYLVTIIDPPFIPEVKSEPSRALICVLITLIGFIFSICTALFFQYFSKNSQKKRL